MKILSKWISISARNGRIFYNRKLARLGLKSGEFLFVLCINDHPGFTQDQLAEELSINKSTVARAVAELIDKGFVYRESNTKDKRIYHLYPTAKATQAYPQIIGTLEEWNTFLVKGLSPQEIQMVDHLLSKISENAQKYAH